LSTLKAMQNHRGFRAIYGLVECEWSVSGDLVETWWIDSEERMS